MDRRMTQDEIEEVIKILWLNIKPDRQAQSIRAKLAFDLGLDDLVPDYVWDIVDIAAARAAKACGGSPDDAIGG